MALNANKVAEQILSGAVQTAGTAWSKISASATIELRGLAQRIVLIVKGLSDGEISKTMAQRHLQTARFHVVATLAMLTTLVEATVEKIVNGALAVVRDIINKAAGFALIL